MDRFLAYIQDVYDWINPYLSRLSVSILILLVGFILGKLSSRFIRKVLDELELDQALRKTVGLKLSMSKLLSGFAAFIVYFITIILFLNHLGLTTAVINAVSIGVIVLVVISAALAIKDFAPNFLAGMMLAKKRRIQPGDRIELKGISGKVVDVSLLDTQIRTSSGDHIFIPNATLIKNVLRKK